MTSEIKPEDIHHLQVKSKIVGTTTEPPDFHQGDSEHRKSILATTALIIVLSLSDSLNPTVFGITVSPIAMWVLVGIGHAYFFVMWRLTSLIESDSDKRFWNLRGLWRQARLGGTKGFPGKTKAQIFFIRSLPIWAFGIGLAGVVRGVLKACPVSLFEVICSVAA